jgi:hypothetical protein
LKCKIAVLLAPLHAEQLSTARSFKKYQRSSILDSAEQLSTARSFKKYQRSSILDSTYLTLSSEGARLLHSLPNVRIDANGAERAVRSGVAFSSCLCVSAILMALGFLVIQHHEPQTLPINLPQSFCPSMAHRHSASLPDQNLRFWTLRKPRMKASSEMFPPQLTETESLLSTQKASLT